jgi:ketosteroid isomerase-like protein
MPVTFKTVLIASLLATAGCSAKSETAAPADSAATKQMSAASVVEHHVAAMKSGDLNAVMSDYADDTVVITPQGLVADQTPAQGPGVYSGLGNARKVFATLTKTDNMGAVKSMKSRIVERGNDVALLYWTQLAGTPKEVSGHDVFVVKNNKVVFQDIVPDAK